MGELHKVGAYLKPTSLFFLDALVFSFISRGYVKFLCFVAINDNDLTTGK